MTPIKQENATDCFRACLASILDLPLEAVPDFYADLEEGDKTTIDAWLSSLGLALIPMIVPHTIHLDEFTALTCPDLHYIQIGMTRKGLTHAVIGRNGEIIHDPAPVPQGEIMPIHDCYHLNLIGKKV